MSTNVTKSYLDLARSVIETEIKAKEGASTEDAIFCLMSCTYVYSYSALLSFCSAQLYILWQSDDSLLKKKYPSANSFEQLMAGPLKSIKCAIKEVIEQKGIQPLHEAEPKLWQNLNEFIKHYRDFFLHPNPERFEEYVGKAGNAQWQLASKTVSGILAYIFNSTNGTVPSWVNESGLRARGFEVTNI
jgi:hypothetical protein